MQETEQYYIIFTSDPPQCPTVLSVCSGIVDGSDLSRVYVTHCLRSLPRMRLLCQRTLTRHTPAVVNALRTVGHCGGSEVKKIEILFSFLHRPIVSCLKTSIYCHEPQGLIWFCQCMFCFLLSKPWVPLTAII